jgi:hypothetical protein
MATAAAEQAPDGRFLRSEPTTPVDIMLRLSLAVDDVVRAGASVHQEGSQLYARNFSPNLRDVMAVRKLSRGDLESIYIGSELVPPGSRSESGDTAYNIRFARSEGAGVTVTLDVYTRNPETMANFAWEPSHAEPTESFELREGETDPEVAELAQSVLKILEDTADARKRRLDAGLGPLHTVYTLKPIAQRWLELSDGAEFTRKTGARIENFLQSYGVDWTDPSIEGVIATLPTLDGRKLRIHISRQFPAFPKVSFAFLHPGYSGTTDGNWFDYIPTSHSLFAGPVEEGEGGLRHVNHLLDIAEHTVRHQGLDPSTVRGEFLSSLEALGHKSEVTRSTGAIREVHSLEAIMPGYQTRKIMGTYDLASGLLQEIDIHPADTDKPRSNLDEVSNTRYTARFFGGADGDSKVELRTTVHTGSVENFTTVVLDPKKNPDLRALHRARVMMQLLNGSVKTYKQ